MFTWALDVRREESGNCATKICAQDDGAVVRVCPSQHAHSVVGSEHGQNKLPDGDPLSGASEMHRNPPPDGRLQERADLGRRARDLWKKDKPYPFPLHDWQQSRNVIPLRMSENKNFQRPVPGGTHPSEALENTRVRPSIHQHVRGTRPEEYRVSLADVEHVKTRFVYRSLRGHQPASHHYDKKPENNQEPRSQHVTQARAQESPCAAGKDVRPS